MSKLLAVCRGWSPAKYSNRKLVAILHNLTSVRHHDHNLYGAKSAIGNQNFELVLSPQNQNVIAVYMYIENQCAVGLVLDFVFKILAVCVF